MGASSSFANVGPFASTSLFEIGQQIRQGATTSLAVTELALNAVMEYGAQLNCFITVDAEGAKRAAKKADVELSSGYDRGPLHGIPLGVKDLMATKGLRTTMGSQHFASHVPDVDADAVTLMRRAGGIVLGKTHTHEFAFGATGDRAHTGPALNPHDTSRITGGSSSGSAAAVAAGLVPVALGSDSAGSVRIPGALCGAVGLRPTAGFISSKGTFPLSQSLDVVAPLARTVNEAAAVWWALSTRAQRTRTTHSVWSSSLLPDPARAAGLRIGQVECALTEKKLSAEQAKALVLSTRALSGIVSSTSCISIPEIDDCSEPHRAILLHEAYALHMKRVKERPELFDNEVLNQLNAAAEVSKGEYARALKLRNQLRAVVLDRILDVDILILPTVPIGAPLVGERCLPRESEWGTVREALKSHTVPWSLLDLPAISIPVLVPGKKAPCAVQLVGKPGRELQLLDAASALEAAVRSEDECQLSTHVGYFR